MEDIHVVFYDGQSSVSRKALLNLTSGFWIIRYTDENFQSHSVKWDINELRSIGVLNGAQVFRYGSFPQQLIECHEEDLISILKQQYPNAKFLKTNTFELKGWKNIVAATLLLIGLLVSVYLYVLPPCAEFLADQIPQDIETSLGISMLNSFIDGSEKDAELSLLVNQFAKNIDFNTTYPIEITVVKKDEINAFALPGGQIVVYDGILKKMKNGGELAALLSHEVAHIEYKHSLKSISRSLSGYIFVSLVFNDVNGITTTLVDNANILNNLSYSRALETDADHRALNTLKANNINQQGVVDLFETLKSGHDFSYLKFLSTHPLTDDRIKYAKAISQKQTYVIGNKKIEEIWKKIQAQINDKVIVKGQKSGLAVPLSNFN